VVVSPIQVQQIPHTKDRSHFSFINLVCCSVCRPYPKKGGDPKLKIPDSLHPPHPYMMSFVHRTAGIFFVDCINQKMVSFIINKQQTKTSPLRRLRFSYNAYSGSFTFAEILRGHEHFSKSVLGSCQFLLGIVTEIRWAGPWQP
jgi:hypothetical protein